MIEERTLVKSVLNIIFLYMSSRAISELYIPATIILDKAVNYLLSLIVIFHVE